MAALNGSIYVADQGGGAISRIVGYGNVLGLAGYVGGATGLTASTATGLLYASGSAGLVSLNPTTGAVSVLATGGFDGLSVSADGTELFAEDNQHVYGYTLSTNAVVFDSGFIAGADGALVANLAGTPVLFVNTNYGDIYEVALSDSTQTLIADSGSRGDIAALDTSNNTAIFSQSNTLVRLSLPAGSSFGVTAVPEPASLALFGIGLFGIARLRRARVNKA